MAKRRSKKELEGCVQLDLFNLNIEKIQEEEKKAKDFNKVKNTLNTIKVESTTKKIKDVKTLDLLLSKENLSLNNNERYENNINAIKLLQKLGNNLASENQQKTLSKYVGWGGLSKKFENKEEDNKLKDLLKDDYSSAKSSVLTSFYTPAYIIKFIYKALDRFGFERGRILEPSVGTGRFLGFMPEEMYYRSKITGIEIDNVSYKITKNLYQSAKIIHSPFQDVNLKDESFDLIVSNIPFSVEIPYGKEDKDLNEHKFHIHDYYFAKAVKKVRPGGIIAFLTSSGTLDKANSKLRDLLDSECELLGAIRLPKGTFTDTEVTTDIIFLQKLENEVKTTDWFDVVEKDGIKINEYFANHPEMMLGEMKMISGQFGPTQALVSDTKMCDSVLNKMLKYLPKDVYVTPVTDEYMYEEEEICEIDPKKDLLDGEFTIENNQLMQRQGDKIVPYNINGVKRNIIIDYINIKDCLKNIIKIQLENCTDEELRMKQSELNTLYDKFNKKYGEVSLKQNKKVLDKDSRYPLVSSIELYDTNTEEYKKSHIFVTRTIGTTKSLTNPKTVEDALLLSECNYGKINIEYAAKLLKRPPISIIVEALEKELIYIYANSDECISDNSKVEYVVKGEFISGYVKDKLQTIKNIIAKLKEIPNDDLTKYQKFLLKYFRLSEATLEANQPEYVTDVYFEMQSSWIPLEIKERFLNKIFKTKYTKLYYTTELGYSVKDQEYIASYILNNEWGTNRVNGLKIAKAALNMTEIEVKDEEPGDTREKTKKVKNVKETQLANTKKEEMKLAFNDFINNDVDLLKSVLDLYNEKFINYVDRKYTNILHNLQINPLVKPRQHQLEGASRIITSQYNTLLFHSVGSGKTYTMIIAAQEMNRISKFGGKRGNKNLFIIPNHLCQSGQFAKDYLTIYPQANILATTPADFTKANRRRLLSKILTSNWDAIIIPYSQLGSIELKPETEAKLIKEDLKDIEEAINYYNEDGNISVKKLEAMRIQMLSRLEELRDMHRDKCGIYWEDLCIDNIFIDEAHNYKNLYFKTKLNVPGVGGTTAKKTTDLYNKIRYQRSVHGEKGIVFATATPLSNSMSEVYTMMKYLCEDVLHRYGFNCFDQWASTFGKVVTNMEVNPTGQGFRFKSSFSKFNNVPELMQLFRHVADIVNIKDIDDIKLPKLTTGKPIDISINPTPEMLDYIDELVERAKLVSEGSVDPTEDNMLLVVNDGRKLAVSPYLVGVNGESPKIDAVADNVARVYKEYDTMSHMVFCDLGTPKKNKRIVSKKEIALDLDTDKGNNGSEETFDINDVLDKYSFKTSHSVYEELKDKLIERGVDEKDIIFIHDYEKPEKKKAILDEFKDAKKRILIGSSSKLSEGVNVCPYTTNCGDVLLDY